MDAKLTLTTWDKVKKTRRRSAKERYKYKRYVFAQFRRRLREDQRREEMKVTLTAWFGTDP